MFVYWLVKLECSHSLSIIYQHPGLKNKSIPIDAQLISESVWRSATNYKPYADYDLPLLHFGDFHGVRKEEQNRFLLDVSLPVSVHLNCQCV